MKEEELKKKIVMFRTELEMQQAHSGENQGIKSLFNTMCSYFGEQDREIESLQQLLKEEYEHRIIKQYQVWELTKERDALQQQNKSYEEALKKVAEYPTVITTSTERYSNAVSIARKSLKGAMTYER